MATKLKPISIANFRVVVEGVSTYWTKFSGFSESRNTFEYNDGLDNQIQEYPNGMVKKTKLTATKPFDPRVDWPTLELFDTFCDDDGLTITVEPINNCKSAERIGTKTMTYYGCQLVDRKGGDVDREGTGGSMLELAFTYESMKPV